MAPPLTISSLAIARMLTAEPVATDTKPTLFELRWSAPPECPQRAQVLERVETLVGKKVEPARTIGPVVEARIDAASSGFTMAFRVQSTTGSEMSVLEARTCAELEEIAAVMIAIAIDPAELDAQPEALEPLADAPKLAARPQDEPSVPARHEPIRSPESKRRVAVTGSLRVFPAFTIGPLPKPGPGIGGAAGVLLPASRIEIGAVYWFYREARLATRPETGADVRAFWLTLRGCGVPSVSIVEFPLCLGLQVGALSAVGVGVDVVETARLPWVALDAGLGLSVVPWRHVALGIDAALCIPFIRSGFALEGLGEVHRTAPAAFLATASVEARFP